MMEAARLLWDWRRVLWKAGIWGLLAATLIAFLIPKQYESTARLMPPDDQSGSNIALLASLSGKMNGGLGSIAGDLLGIKSSGGLFIGILRSRTVQDELIKKYDLRKVYWKATWDEARQRLSSNTSIFEDRKSGIISITVTDRSPERSAGIARDYVAELNTVVSQLSTSSARRERLFLEGRLQEVRQDLEAAETNFSEFSSKNGAIDIKEQGKAMVEAASTEQGRLIAAQSELQGLKQIYSDNNVRVRAVGARVAELRSQLEKMNGKSDQDAAGEEVAALYPSIRELPLLGVAYADLYRRTKVEEAVFETLTQQYELAKVSEAKQIPSIKVLDAPEVPERKSFPSRLLIIAAGPWCSVAVLCAWRLAITRWRQTDDTDLRKRLAQEILQTLNGRMPWASSNGSTFHSATRRIWLKAFQRNDHPFADDLTLLPNNGQPPKH